MEKDSRAYCDGQGWNGHLPPSHSVDRTRLQWLRAVGCLRGQICSLR